MDRRTFLTSVGTGCIAGGVLAENLPYEQNVAEPKEAPKSFRAIDTHLHVFDTSLEGKNDVPKYISTSATVEDALAAMDLGCVGKAFLISYCATDVGVQIRARGFRPDAVREVLNKDYQYRAFKAHVDRFWWFTDHVDPLRPGYSDDLQKDIEAGAAGVKLLASIKAFCHFPTDRGSRCPNCCARRANAPGEPGERRLLNRRRTASAARSARSAPRPDQVAPVRRPG